jgi:hypothetical protein
MTTCEAPVQPVRRLLGYRLNKPMRQGSQTNPVFGTIVITGFTTTYPVSDNDPDSRPDRPIRPGPAP